jgi:hypothetical protein
MSGLIAVNSAPAASPSQSDTSKKFLCSMLRPKSAGKIESGRWWAPPRDGSRNPWRARPAVRGEGRMIDALGI